MGEQTQKALWLKPKPKNTQMTSSRMKTWQKTFWQSNLAISRHETYPICTFGVPSCSLIFPFKVEIAEPIWHSILILLGRYGFPRRQMIISDVQWIYFYIYIHIFPELLINRPLDHHSSMTFPYFQIKYLPILHDGIKHDGIPIVNFISRSVVTMEAAQPPQLQWQVHQKGHGIS